MRYKCLCCGRACTLLHCHTVPSNGVWSGIRVTAWTMLSHAAVTWRDARNCGASAAACVAVDCDISGLVSTGPAPEHDSLLVQSLLQQCRGWKAAGKFRVWDQGQHLHLALERGGLVAQRLQLRRQRGRMRGGGGVERRAQISALPRKRCRHCVRRRLCVLVSASGGSAAHEEHFGSRHSFAGLRIHSRQQRIKGMS